MIGLENAERGAHALVVGNSTWRAGFPVGDWSGPVVGCNAVYRDAHVDYLCVFGPGMIREIRDAELAGWPRTCAPTNIVYRQRSAHPRPDASGTALWTPWDFTGADCGTMAIHLAHLMGCAAITVVGFSGDLARDNVYLGTPNYQQERRRTTGVPLAMKRLRDSLAPWGNDAHVIVPARWFTEHRGLDSE